MHVGHISDMLQMTTETSMLTHNAVPHLSCLEDDWMQHMHQKQYRMMQPGGCLHLVL